MRKSTHNRKIAVIGLGYVGLPVAAAFAKVGKVIAFDINQKRIQQLRKGIDHTGEVDSKALLHKNFQLSSDPQDLRQADFFIVAVPTPVNQANQPDLSALQSASQIVAGVLKKGDIVVYESTVYPGATEEICALVLEEFSQLKSGRDFYLGYSPERINPGDKTHTFSKIKKIVAGQNPAVRKIIARVYGSVVEAGIYEASSIKVAEAAKVIENTQRDLNIAFVNELAMIFHRLDIDSKEVFDAAATKWNFLPFKPGLVGGHCIGVDPYYLTHKAESAGFHPQIILAGRRVNDGMGKYIAEETVKLLAARDIALKNAKVGILGLTFKENCADIRNTKVVDIIQELSTYSMKVLIHDPLADAVTAKNHYNLTLSDIDQWHNVDALILAVPHEAFIKWPLKKLIQLLKPKTGIVVDVKSVLDADKLKAMGIALWRL